MTELELATLPGGKLVAQGLSDFAHGRDTAASLLVQIAASRLRAAGLPLPETPVAPGAELRLYAVLCEHEPDAYGRYNALLRDLVSCERALELRAARQAVGAKVEK